MDLRWRLDSLRGLLFVAIGAAWCASTPLVRAEIVIHEIMYHPASEVSQEEYVELVNRGAMPVNVEGWSLEGAIGFTFPAISMNPGAYLVVAADPAVFGLKYPGVTNVVGGWHGSLASSDEEILLRDAGGVTLDRVHYADEGDWAIRQRSLLDYGSRGWLWHAPHDGGGYSLELIQPALPNDYGQNWMASLKPEGTPGAPNGAAATDIAPLILNVAHHPPVPRSGQTVHVTARVIDESNEGLTVRLHYRPHTTTNPPPFTELNLADDGRQNDAMVGDGIWGIALPPQPAGTVVEFYLSAQDRSGLERTWPAPARDENNRPAQSANALLQIDDEPYLEPQPMLRLVLTGSERAELLGMDQRSNAEMNASLISTDAFETRLRYNVGVRIRGQGTRAEPVVSYRVNVPSDRRWEGQVALNLNSYFSHSQVAGMSFALKAGMPVPSVRAAQVRINGVNLARSEPPLAGLGSGFGTWALSEVVNTDWARRIFPNDPSGNVYFARRPNTDLRYLGTNSANYVSAGYSKESNRSENDWSDLIQLTWVLNETRDEDYLTELAKVADIREWARYFAVNNFLGNNETSLAVGIGDDYDLYRGMEDPRFLLVPHDLDTILGGYGSLRVTADLFWAMRLPVLNRFLGHPEIAPVYYAELRRLVDEFVAPGVLDAMLDQLLGAYVTPATLASMKDYAQRRAAYIKSVTSTSLTIEHELPSVGGLPRSPSATVLLFGSADVIRTRRVLVSGVPAEWIAWQGRWTNAASLLPGLNRITVETRDASEQPVERQHVDIWYDTDSETVVAGGTLANTATWAAARGPFSVRNPVTIPAGSVLHIEPGTTVLFGPTGLLTVNGRLVAEGTAERPIRFAVHPGSAEAWPGIDFVKATGPSRLAHLVLEHTAAYPLEVRESTLHLDHVVFSSPYGAIYTSYASLRVQHCTFPDMIDNETIAGYGMPANGEVVIEGNTFGSTTGYADIVDFTGGRRPGPILQVLNNVFLGGSDDGLDVDATDAHIEGNVFMNFHKDAPRESDSSAVATDTGSEVVLARNVFWNNDHGLLLKGGASVVAQHNVWADHTQAALALGTTNPAVAPGRGGVLEGEIFWDNAHAFSQLQALRPGVADPELTVRQSLFSDLDWPGDGNLRADPWFVDSKGDFRLRAGSPARGAGPNGLDMGPYVPAGASVGGEPPWLTGSTEAMLRVGGPGILAYRYRIDEGPWTEVSANVREPLVIRALGAGPHRVAVVGMNSAGVWQSTNAPTLSKSWVVQPGLQRALLSEVLARNLTTSNHIGTFPDLIELHNPGTDSADLSGLRLTDDPARPGKFVFPPNTALAPGAYLVVFADNPSGTPGLHTGFALSSEGEGVYLYEAANRGGALLDSVVFGMQIPDYSLGRLDDGSWTLTKPTFGGPNRPARLGNPDALRITEWLAAGEEDFIEVHNPMPIAVELSGLFLTDNFIGQADRHAIAPLSFIAANSYTRFVADGNVTRGADHLNFGLARQEGMIALVRADRSLIDSVIYSSQRFGVSQGRATPASHLVLSYAKPSPGAANQPNLPPAVSIQAPTPGQAFAPSASVVLVAAASDPEGALARVEFYSGAVRIGEVRQPPYTLTWSNIPPGSLVLTAQAWDAEGAVATSSPVPILSARLGVTLTGPPLDTPLTQGQSVTLEASVFNGGIPPPRVEFFVGGLKVGEASSTPYRWQGWVTNAGVVDLQAVGFRADGDRAESAPLSMRVLTSRWVDSVLVTSNAFWRFWDRGLHPGPDWMAPAYDDSSWSQGPAELGYGEGDEATVLSYGADPANKNAVSYFRHTFSVDIPTACSGIKLRLLADDGAVTFLNGQELLRVNLPEGPLTAASLASSNALERIWVEHEVTPERLAPGTNWLCVAVHQYVSTSSDLSFAAALIGTCWQVEPWIRTQPTDQRVEIGQPIMLTVEADGRPLHYRWYATGRPDEPLASTPTLRLDGLEPVNTDRFSYYLVVSNALGQATSRVATITVAAPDQDGDGMPDYWERLHGLNPSDPADARDDWDGDGLENQQEFRLRLDPAKPDLILRALGPPAGTPAGNWILRFYARSGVTYLIESAPDIPSSEWQVVLRIPPSAVGQTAEMSLPLQSNRAFFRVQEAQD